MTYGFANYAAAPSSVAKCLFLYLLIAAFLFQPSISTTLPPEERNWQAKFMKGTKKGAPIRRGPPSPESWHGRVPLVITNKCDDTIWPGLATQAGTGPGTGGFELESGTNKTLWVSGDWQGRIWGRTNCTGSGDSCKCKTGDCFGKLSCEYSVSN